MVEIFCDYCEREIETEKEVIGVCPDCGKVICVDCIKKHDEQN